MGIPAAGINLHEADALLDEAPGEQAAASEWIGFFLIDSVKGFGLRGFFCEVDDAGDFTLHAKGEFVGLEPSWQVFMAGVALLMQSVELGHQIEIAALFGAGNSRRRI